MRFRCGKKDCPGLTLTGPPCERCDLEISVRGMWRYAIHAPWNRLKRILSIQCPNCTGLIPGFQGSCQTCGNTLTVSKAVEHTVAPHRNTIQSFIAPTSWKKRLFQWTYLAVSVYVFWLTLDLLERRYHRDWGNHALLSIVYLAVFLLVSLWIIPQRTFVVIAHYASKIIKLGLIFNYLTAFIYLQMVMATWWTRSLMLGVLFFATWAGAFIFLVYLWPIAGALSRTFVPPGGQSFDRNAPQGRNVRFD